MAIILRNSTLVKQAQLMRRENMQSGFTLVELMVSMVIAGMLLAVMIFAFIAQSSSYNTQQEIATLQEDLRAALSMMSSEIRMANYNPTNDSNAKIITAAAGEFRFSMDLDADGITDDTNEDVRYQIDISDSESTRLSLERQTTDSTDTIAENIEQLAFDYLLDDGTWTATPTNTESIRAVKICVLGRTARKTSASTDTSSFNPEISTTPSWTPATPGGYQRRMQCVIVQLRNQQG